MVGSFMVWTILHERLHAGWMVGTYGPLYIGPVRTNQPFSRTKQTKETQSIFFIMEQTY
jgi:hypothetical protein